MTNSYCIVLLSTTEGSVGTMLVPNLTDFSSPPIVAGDVTFREMELPPQEETIGEIVQTAVLSPGFVGESLTYILAHNNTFPAYMEMDVKSAAYARFMFVSKVKQHVLPKKYC